MRIYIIWGKAQITPEQIKKIDLKEGNMLIESEKGIVWINLNKVEWIKLEPTQKKKRGRNKV